MNINPSKKLSDTLSLSCPMGRHVTFTLWNERNLFALGSFASRPPGDSWYRFDSGFFTLYQLLCGLGGKTALASFTQCSVLSHLTCYDKWELVCRLPFSQCWDKSPARPETLSAREKIVGSKTQKSQSRARVSQLFTTGEGSYNVERPRGQLLCDIWYFV